MGKTLRGTYLIHESLDQGGMGMVFVAEHVRLRRKVAVKVLVKHLMNDQHALARFHREAEIISQLNHPSIVQGWISTPPKRVSPTSSWSF